MALQHVYDTLGRAFCLDACSKMYTYNGPAGAVDTITATDPASGSIWIKTYVYAGNNISSESGWVKQ
jgi:hypothetical protein